MIKIIITAIVTFVVTSIFWVVCIFGLYSYIAHNQPDFIISVDAPSVVSKGEVFELIASTENPTDGVLTLGSIDIYDSLLEGFEVVEVKPRPDSTDSTMGFTTFYYSKELDPADSHVMTLRLKAKEAGIWTGDIDFCTPAESFVTSTTTIVVNE